MCWRFRATGLWVPAWEQRRSTWHASIIPDLIILDIRLPDISGVEAVRQLKADELTRTIPIIAVTAVAMREDERKILNAGCDLYVAKPFIPSEFVETVAN